jgi:hypothetical protein
MPSHCEANLLATGRTNLTTLSQGTAAYVLWASTDFADRQLKQKSSMHSALGPLEDDHVHDSTEEAESFKFPDCCWQPQTPDSCECKLANRVQLRTFLEYHRRRCWQTAKQNGPRISTVARTTMSQRPEPWKARCSIFFSKVPCANLYVVCDSQSAKHKLAKIST